MGWQVVKQPDGRLAIWSSIVGDFIAEDMSLEECCDFFAEDVFRDLLDRVRKFSQAASWVLDGTPAKAYHQFTMTWDDAMRDRASREQHDDNGVEN
jgi:hypothetical protein